MESFQTSPPYDAWSSGEDFNRESCVQSESRGTQRLSWEQLPGKEGVHSPTGASLWRGRGVWRTRESTQEREISICGRLRSSGQLVTLLIKKGVWFSLSVQSKMDVKPWFARRRKQNRLRMSPGVVPFDLARFSVLIKQRTGLSHQQIETVRCDLEYVNSFKKDSRKQKYI